MKLRSVVPGGTQFDPARPSRDWLVRIERTAAAYISLDPQRAGAKLLSEARNHVRRCQEAIEEGNAKSAAFYALAALQASWSAEIKEGLPMIHHGVTALRATERHNAGTAADAAARRGEWQREANVIWRKHPKWRASEVARKIDSAKANTIRRHIKRPSPK